MHYIIIPMRKLIVLAIILVACVSSAFAQKGEMGGGVQLNYGTQIKGMGIGAKFQYGIADAVRVEPSFNYYFGKGGGNMFDFNLNAHYLFDVTPKVKVYPLVGIGFASLKFGGISYDGGDNWENDYPGDGEWSDEDTSGGSRSKNFTVNLGIGGEYQLTDRLAINVEAKYQIISNFNQLVIGAGVSYKF